MHFNAKEMQETVNVWD